ncbi:MAG: LacI family DNA-binding transcriptional regulator [Treponema sp.]
MITIYDLAKITGFSAPTVSKALNGTGKLSDETRKKILDAAKQNNYKINIAARALTTKHTKLIGVILEDVAKMRGFEHPLFGGILNTFRKEMDNAGYDLIFLSKTFSTPMSYLDHCRYRNVEGILIVNPPENDPEMKTFANSGIPCVSTNEFIPGICTIVSDNKKAGEEATDILINAGHRKIGFIGPAFKENSPASLERHEGYKVSLKKHNLKFEEDLTQVCGYWHSESGYIAAQILFTRRADITAVFAANDTIAYGVMKYIKEVGKKIPQDISIIGFDDDRMAAYTSPALSTFKQNRDRIAELAADLLLQNIAGVPVPEIVRVPTEFVKRESVSIISL